jgi:hypothetical protein
MVGGNRDTFRSALDVPPPVRTERPLPHALQSLRPPRPERRERRRRALRRLPQREGVRARAALHEKRPRLRLVGPTPKRAPRRAFCGISSACRRGDRFPHRVGALLLDPEQGQCQADPARPVQPTPQHAARSHRHRRAALRALVSAHADLPLRRRLPDRIGASLGALSLAVPVHLQRPTQRATRHPTHRAARRPRRLALRKLPSALAFCRLFSDRLLAPVLHVGYGARRAAGDIPPLVTFAAPICALRPPPRGLLRRAATVHAATGQRRRRSSYHRPAAVDLRAPSTDMPRHPDGPEALPTPGGEIFIPLSDGNLPFRLPYPITQPEHGGGVSPLGVRAITPVSRFPGSAIRQPCALPGVPHSVPRTRHLSASKAR